MGVHQHAGVVDRLRRFGGVLRFRRSNASSKRRDFFRGVGDGRLRVVGAGDSENVDASRFETNDVRSYGNVFADGGTIQVADAAADKCNKLHRLNRFWIGKSI